MGQRDVIVGPYSYMAIFHPGWKLIYVFARHRYGKDEPNTLSFSRRKVNGSKLMSQWKCMSGLNEVRWAELDDL